jgi:hypothetical protein
MIKGLLAAEHHVEHSARTPDVDLLTNGSAEMLLVERLGEYLRSRKCKGTSFRHHSEILSRLFPGHIEISDSHFQLLGHQNVLGLDVSVTNTSFLVHILNT